MKHRMIFGMAILGMSTDEVVESLRDKQLNTNPLLEFQTDGLGGLDFDPTAELLDDQVDLAEWLDADETVASLADADESEELAAAEPTDDFADLAVEINHDGQPIVRGVANRLLPRIDRAFAGRELKAFREVSGVSGEFVSQMTEHFNEVKNLDLAIKSRFQTMKRVAQATAEFQRDFFQDGPTALKPLTKEQLAEQMGLADSTVCRAVRGKLVRTERFGVIDLGELFPACRVDAAKESHLESRVFAVVKDVVRTEDIEQPLSDAQLAERMLAHGMRFERKTVSRLRAKLDIPASSQRRNWHRVGGFDQAV